MRLRSPFRFSSRWLLTLAVAAGFAAATPADAALPCRATATSTNAGQVGTTAANTIDGLTGTFLQTNYDNWQHVQLNFECEIEISGFRRNMLKGTLANRGAQGEQFLVSQDGVNWTYVTRAASTGWQIYNAYNPQAWHSVNYGWSAWLRPTTPLRARFVRFRWDGNLDTLNEIELDARTVFRVDSPKLTQNGLITRSLPPMPLVAGKTTLVVGRIGALPGGPARADSARLDIFRQDTGALVASVNGFAIAADDRSLLPAVNVGDDVHFFISGTDLTLAGPLRLEALLTAGGRTHRQVLLSNVTMAENEGLRLMIVDHDEGVLRGFNDLGRFATVLDHTTRMYPIKDSHGSMLPSGAPTSGAVGLRYEYTMNLPLPVQGTQADPRNAFVLTNYRQGNTCSANPTQVTLFPNRVLPINFTGVEDLNRNGLFEASEVNFCTSPPGASSGIGERFNRWQGRVNFDSNLEATRAAVTNREEFADYRLGLVSGGGNRQNPSGLLGVAGPRQGWATLTGTGTNHPALPHELLHELGIQHSNSRTLPGPGYDLMRLRRVRQPFSLIFGDISFPVEEAFLSDAEFDAARAQIPAARGIDRPRLQGETLSIQGVLTADDSIADLSIRVHPEALFAEPVRADLELALLDGNGEELVRGPAELLPSTENDQPAGLPSSEDWLFRGELPWPAFKAEARWLIVRDRAVELVREPVLQANPTVKLLSWNFTGNQVTASWDGTHPTGRTPTFDVTVEYPDGRIVPLAVGTTQKQLSLSAGRLPGGSNLTLKVVAFAGARTAVDQVTGLALTNQTPWVVLLGPTQGETFASGASIPLSAFATDPEDGVLSGASVVWTSSLGGYLGTGTRLRVTLPPGVQTIAVKATDGAGSLSSDAVTVTVQ